MAMTTNERDGLKRWFHSRLTEGSRPREEWRALWDASWEHLLAMPLRDLIDPVATRALAEQMADTELVTELLRPIVVAAAPVIVADLRDAEQPVDRLLPAEALEKLEAVMARPGLVHPDFVRAVFRGDAAEEVINDALYRALKDFSTLLPRLLVKISPMGRFGVLGSAGAFAEKLIGDLEKLIEPEIKSFLADGTGRVLERAADFTIEQLDDSTSIEFRLNLIRFMLSKSPAFYLEGVDDELLADMGAIVELTVPHAGELPSVRESIRSWIDRALEYVEDKSLAEVLQLEERQVRPPVDALADATWPVFTALLKSPHALAWLDSIADEFIDEFERIQS